MKKPPTWNETEEPDKETVKHVADFSNGKLSNLMTGQEWYDRFLKELPDGQFVFNSDLKEFKAIKNAAMRAAGYGQKDRG